MYLIAILNDNKSWESNQISFFISFTATGIYRIIINVFFIIIEKGGDLHVARI